MPRKPTRGHQPPRQYPDRKPTGAPPDASRGEDSNQLRAKEQKGRPGYRRVDPKTAPPKR
jgi:hypothetical protein